jgi:histidyl-tRNA synthetase
MKIQRCKGMRDLSPEEMALFHFVKGICRDCFQKWGYREVRTPTIEYLHLFTSAGTLTPGRLGKVYSFLDWDGWSGERVVLRPDGTIPVARLYTDKMQGQGLARLFYAANMFMFEESGQKNREQWQCGAELIGAGSALADAELVALSMEIVNKLDLKGVELRLSHAGLIKILLQKLGLSPEEQHKVFDRILDGDTKALAGIGKASPELNETILPFLSLKGQSAGFLRNQRALLTGSIPEIKAPLDDFLKTVAVLDELGLKYQINIASGSGFEYYTGLIFQLYKSKEKIGGGGRYDALIPSMGGGDVPASGFALYLDSLMNFVKIINNAPPPPRSILISIVSGESIKEAYKLAEALHKAGYIAEIDLGGREKTGKRIIEVRSKSPVFTLVDKVKPGKITAESVDDVLKQLEGKGDG